MDSLYEDIGVCGWYPLGVFFLLHIVGISRSFMFLGNAMMSYTPAFHCGDVEYVEDGDAFETPTTTTTTTTAPTTESFFFHNATTANATLTCAQNCANNYTYSVPRSYSFVAEWDVVCDREPLKYLTEMFFYLGCLVACCFIGYLSDTFGRRTVILAAALFGGLVGCQAFWIPNFYGYLVRE